MIREKGQVALETLVISVAWLFSIGFLLNLFFVISTLMLVQSNVNRAAVQMASTGCVIESIREQLEADIPGFAPGSPETVAVSRVPDRGVFAAGLPLAVCGNAGEVAGSGDLVKVSITYEQPLIWLGGSLSRKITREAVVSSSNLGPSREVP